MKRPVDRRGEYVGVVVAIAAQKKQSTGIDYVMVNLHLADVSQINKAIQK
jgi:hypothetical protein